MTTDHEFAVCREPSWLENMELRGRKAFNLGISTRRNGTVKLAGVQAGC
jgi:hypothetical protein